MWRFALFLRLVWHPCKTPAEPFAVQVLFTGDISNWPILGLFLRSLLSTLSIAVFHDRQHRPHCIVLNFIDLQRLFQKLPTMVEPQIQEIPDGNKDGFWMFSVSCRFQTMIRNPEYNQFLDYMCPAARGLAMTPPPGTNRWMFGLKGERGGRRFK